MAAGAGITSMKKIVCLCVLGVLAGCGPTTLYEWGGYEPSLYLMYIQAGEFNVQETLAGLAQEVEKTNADGRLVPPGKYAHLGYLSYMAGDTAAASGYFQAEKQAFPESAKFMDRMLEQVK